MDIIGGNDKNVTVGTITVDSSHTGNLNETVVGTILIPADMYVAGDVLIIQDLWKKPILGGSYTNSIYLNTTPDLAGAPKQILTNNGNTKNRANIRNYFVKSSDLMCNSSRIQATNYDWRDVNNDPDEVAVDFTNILYAVITCQLTDAGDTATLRGAILERKRPYFN